MLQINQVQKKYNQRTVLEITNLVIGEGIHWLKGTNGSGKSTFMKMAGGLIPFEGEIKFNGLSLKESAVMYKRLVCYAEAEPLYPEFLTGEDLIHFYNSTRKAAKKDADDLIYRFGITDFYKNPTGTYSSGMVKKLSLVLAFLGNTKLILLDEPFVTLDVAAVQVVLDTIKEFHQQGRNFIFTSHQSPETATLSLTSEMIAQNNTICFLS
jgi:ABC-2 type transport system ATP-binding protein